MREKAHMRKQTGSLESMRENASVPLRIAPPAHHTVKQERGKRREKKVSSE